ncbi:MAG: ATP-binding cassette domain-containing protein [Deinococcales bacterium]
MNQTLNQNLLPSGTPSHQPHGDATSLVARVLANDKVNFDVKSGEVHASRRNGAGKKAPHETALYFYRPDEGEICFDNVPHWRFTARRCHPLGHWHDSSTFHAGQFLNQGENVALGLKSSRGFVTDLDVVSKRIEELAELYGLKVDPKAYIWQLSVGQQQRVEIIKALYRGAALLILDEPTAVLTPQEVNDFFITLRHMASDGHGLIFISHKLQEVMDFTDRVTVLRDGRNVATVETKHTNKEELARLMVGRELKLRS